ncbi:defective in cullin neddylation protein [Striga asiatica]|uniref:Defective in cullin neddylation protein n=1 Tax=Striga asiatica TaxID=4170 RepID=A0A5A7QPV3_STRAF|nr:defective in cullin neddylation protein [Striga asiatica]
MTRASKRKSDVQNSLPAKSARADSIHSASSKVSAKGYQRIDEFFNKYADKTSGMIEPEGIEALCSDLEVDYTDIKILILAWKMNAQKQGYFTQDEWRRGLKALRVDNINKLKKSLPELKKEALKSVNFEDFYLFAFRYCLTEEKQKCLDIESTCILIDLVLGFQYPAQVDSFIQFLKISFPDLRNYDTCEAWPLLLDNFVDWLKKEAV